MQAPQEACFPRGTVGPGSSLKRVFDCAVVLLAVPIVAPLVLLLWRFGEQAFYRQSASDVGRAFRIWKHALDGVDAEGCSPSLTPSIRRARAPMGQMES